MVTSHSRDRGPAPVTSHSPPWSRLRTNGLSRHVSKLTVWSRPSMPRVVPSQCPGWSRLTLR
eukprot:3152507-Rhodomonas_salina.1